ncbi:energy-coupling factor ABC transporter substrate-binding protein [Clostridium aminobutyricum]|uniref:Cobalt transport protein CbiN n=1 Tax=Clostridium aminobutyricum TaxID=33953 RepID=A0A939IHW9_CLOAM|nr:energy-coupling factor ABC transporter substrate-binding protein [Clostridium aminobutyricum]MBN7771899.1 energy-coupling factor ABC transporter substrate-binding protein [Clostridium aminobutyricum]
MSLSKNGKVVIFCLILAVIIAVVPLLFIHDSEFGGADGEAEEVITAINPNYHAWAQPLLEPPGGETESLLFCLQAATGSGLFFFGMGYLVARKKFQKKEKQE